MSFLSEFKAFAMRGNVVDLAVGVVIGAAFGKIVASFVGDVLMPPIGLLLGGVNFTDFQIVLKDAILDPATGGIAKAAVIMKIGSFIQTLVDFTIIAFAIFLMIKGINKLGRKKEEVPAAPPAPTKDQELLTEIRDLLKK
ncbi:MAG TPA: large-conductance mechanosensitive channel protein MscL [Bacteroidales bacterium]|nr:large-conductance mechanosensitive channel protein MscL [Bacteroidales bacterium]HPS74553.1 large-conductance mechanosensitive channel protein MscL [Bacteroidales bacterium]